MNDPSSIISYFPVLMTALVVVGFVSVTMFLTHWLGPNRRTKVKMESFECGIPSQGDARLPFSVKYFLVAILFVLFDVEVIFMYPWAVQFRELGLIGLFEMLAFMTMLLTGFFYVIRKGALDWEE
jgi:NADH-quinone oxidoreductase subunit A